MIIGCSKKNLENYPKRLLNREIKKPGLKFHPLHPDISFHILHTVLYNFLRCWQGELVEQSKASLVGDHFLHSHELTALFRGDADRRI